MTVFQVLAYHGSMDASTGEPAPRVVDMTPEEYMAFRERKALERALRQPQQTI